MSNRYWKSKIINGKRVRHGPSMCDLTDKPCIDWTRFCSTCPIEFKGFSYEEALEWFRSEGRFEEGVCYGDYPDIVMQSKEEKIR